MFSLLSGALLAKTLSLLFLRGRALGFLYVPLLLFALLFATGDLFGVLPISANTEVTFAS